MCRRNLLFVNLSSHFLIRFNENVTSFYEEKPNHFKVYRWKRVRPGEKIFFKHLRILNCSNYRKLTEGASYRPSISQVCDSFLHYVRQLIADGILPNASLPRRRFWEILPAWKASSGSSITIPIKWRNVLSWLEKHEYWFVWKLALGYTIPCTRHHGCPVWHVI